MRAKILNASAGAGKTYRLAYHYVRDIVEQPTIYRHILAVTFTNKATEEMKSRILKEIHTLAEGLPSPYMKDLQSELHLSAEEIGRRAAEARTYILHDYSRFTVLTIDTFFQRILRAFIKELSLDLNYNIELNPQMILEQSADALIEDITADEELLQWITRFVEERIEEGRRWDIRDGILTLGDELFKERNKESLSTMRSREELQQIIDRLTAQSEKEGKQLEAQAAEVVAIIENAGADYNQFPGKSRGFATWFYKLAEGNLAPYTATITKACNETEAWGKPQTISQQLRPTLQPMLCQLVRSYDGWVRHTNTVALLRETYRSFALLGDLSEKVKELCNQQQLMFLSETKYLLAEFIKESDAPFIYEKVGNRFERFLIDEFQDTSVREWENFLPLLKNAISQAQEKHTAVLLVGDVKQSIYRWRGGDWRILHNKAAEALGVDDTEVVNMEDNWRSMERVVKFNNEMMRRVVEADSATMKSRLDDIVATGDLTRKKADELCPILTNAYSNLKQTAQRKDRLEGGYISIESYDQKSPLITHIRQVLDRGYRPSDILVLARTHAQGVEIAAELLDFKASNSDPRYRFDVMTQEALIIGSAPISNFITASFHLALNPDDSISLARHNHYLGRRFDEPLSDEERRFFLSLGLLSPEELFEQIVLRYHLSECSDETAYLQAMHEQVLAYSSRKIADTAHFLAWWEEQGSTRSLSVEQSSSTIEISTIHKAKGLERPVVLIPYCTWDLDPRASGFLNNIVWAEADQGEATEVGNFPIRYKGGMGQSDFASSYYTELVHGHIDHINLLYVALTRAQEELHILLPRDCKNDIGALIRKVIQIDPATNDCRVGEEQGHFTQLEDGCERFEFGAATGPRKEKDSGSDTIVMSNYPTSKADMRLRFPSTRYFEEEDHEAPLSPRDFGILMHRAFEQATDKQGIGEAIEAMQQQGVISSGEALTLTKMVEQALDNPTVRSWFDGSWDDVRTEHEILRPGNYRQRRPDRVMISGSRAVVVDYKFGELQINDYRRQIDKYCQLLREMGYTEVEGWLWYVTQGKVEQVV